jgi:hypothetical protein
MDGNDILSEAHGIIRGERLQHYGPPTRNFRRIADGWSAYLGLDTAVDELVDDLNAGNLDDLRTKLEGFKTHLTVNDVCALMVILKQMRMADNGYHRDSAVDTCGYAALQEILEEGVGL